jgi:hypothetical protein
MSGIVNKRVKLITEDPDNGLSLIGTVIGVGIPKWQVCPINFNGAAVTYTATVINNRARYVIATNANGNAVAIFQGYQGQELVVYNNTGHTLTVKGSGAGATGVQITNGSTVILRGTGGTGADFVSVTTIANALTSGATLTDVINNDCKYVTSATPVTSSTALVPITGLSVALTGGGVYMVRVFLPITCNVAGGALVALAASGGLTATSMNYTAKLLTATGLAVGTTTTIGTGIGSTAQVIGAEIDGVIVVNVGGNLVAQIAQNFSSGAGATTALVNGYMLVTRIA